MAENQNLDQSKDEGEDIEQTEKFDLSTNLSNYKVKHPDFSDALKDRPMTFKDFD